MISNDGAISLVSSPQTWRQVGFPSHFLLRRRRWTGKELTAQGHTAKRQPDWELKETTLGKEPGP